MESVKNNGLSKAWRPKSNSCHVALTIRPLNVASCRILVCLYIIISIFILLNQIMFYLFSMYRIYIYISNYMYIYIYIYRMISSWEPCPLRHFTVQRKTFFDWVSWQVSELLQMEYLRESGQLADVHTAFTECERETCCFLDTARFETAFLWAKEYPTYQMYGGFKPSHILTWCQE